MEEESASQQEPETPDSGSTPAPAKKGSNTRLWIAIAVAIVLLLLTIGLGFGLSNYDPGEPTPGTRSAGSTTCSDWSAAQPGFQSAITQAANTVGIHPALLGSIFLSEHGNNWPDKPLNGPWASSPKGAQGPFQIVNFSAKWDDVKKLGFSAKAEGNAQDFNDAALAAATYLYLEIKQVKFDLKTTEANEVKCLGAGYNGGPDMCVSWKNRNYGSPEPATDDNYHNRVWDHFQNLSVGCTTASYAGATGIKDVVPVPGLHQCAFGNSGICDSGCSHTSVAMVARYFGDRNKTPMDIKASGLGVNGYVNNNPSFQQAEHFITKPGDQFPLEKVALHLSEKHPIIMRFRTYTENGKTGHKRGHYVVIVGISSDKTKILIEDPFGWIPTLQPKQNGNPPITHLINPDNYGETSDGYKFEFWATKAK